MHRRMRLVDELNSGAIWWNYFFSCALNATFYKAWAIHADKMKHTDHFYLVIECVFSLL
jgi:hypothetical protein